MRCLANFLRFPPIQLTKKNLNSIKQGTKVAWRSKMVLLRSRILTFRWSFTGTYFNSFVAAPDILLNRRRRMVGREGFEPSKAKPADLQSAAIDHSATCPHFYSGPVSKPKRKLFVSRHTWLIPLSLLISKQFPS